MHEWYTIIPLSELYTKTQKYLFDHYLHFLKLHLINNYINSLFIWSRRLPLRPHVVAGMIYTVDTNVSAVYVIYINAWMVYNNTTEWVEYMIFIIWQGVISSNMDNSALGNNKNYLPSFQYNCGKKPVLLVIFPVSCIFPRDNSAFIRYWPINCKLRSEHVKAATDDIFAICHVMESNGDSFCYFPGQNCLYLS